MLSKAQALSQEALDDVRSSVSTLRERSSEKLSPLPEMIKKVMEDSSSLTIKSNLKVSGTPREISPQVHWTLFRAAQEGISNICKHSQASEYSIALSYEDPSFIQLVVKDNGKGTSEFSEGFGLIGLRERVAYLNGALSILHDDSQGFGFEVNLPG